MNYFSTSAILNAVTSILVSLFILLNNPRSPKNRSFAYFGFSVFLWAFFYNIWITTTSKETALFYMRISIGLATFIPTTFFHFAVNLIEEYKEYRKSIQLLYLYSFIIFLTSPFKLFIKDAVPLLMFHYWPLAGITYNFHVLNYFITPIFGFIIISKKIKHSPPIQAKQLNLVLWGIFFSYIGGATNFPLNYSIPLPPVGNIFVSLYTIFIAYAAFKYQLMYINIIIKKSLLYTLLITIITLFYFLSSYLIEHFFQSMFGYTSLFISLASATFIALAFIPLRNFIQDFIEKTLFKGSYLQITKENERLREEITQSDRFKNIALLASGLAHEIKNPLTTLKTFSEYVSQKKNDAEFMKQYERIIPQEISRIDNLVHELLFFAKPSPPEMQTINPNEIINNIILMLEHQFKSFNINVSIKFNTNTLVQADPNQLKQAILNLILNAIDAMPNGGRLTINTSVIARNEVTKQSQYCIEISDTGCGIDPNDLPHIFEPFFTKKEQGTGLGLAITQGIIEKHGGKITVKSQLRQGTTFRIQLEN